MIKQILVAASVVLVVSGLGIFFWSKNRPTSINLKTPTTLEKTSNPALFQNIDDVLKPFESSPSAAQLKEYTTAVERLAEQGTNVTLNDCNPIPQILKSSTSEISFNNNSSKEIKITGLPSLKAAIPPGRTVAVKIEPALYPYSCNFIATFSAIPSVRGLIYFPQTMMATGMEKTKNQAVETNLLNLASCKADHNVIKIKQGDSLTFKNTGKERERIYLSGVWDFNLEIAAQSTQQVNLNPGVHTLSCQSKTSDFIPTSLIYIP